MTSVLTFSWQVNYQNRLKKKKARKTSDIFRTTQAPAWPCALTTLDWNMFIIIRVATLKTEYLHCISYNYGNFLILSNTKSNDRGFSNFCLFAIFAKMAPFWDFTFKRKRVAIGIPLEEEAVGIPPDFTIIRPSAFLTTVWTSDFKIYCSKFPTHSTVKYIYYECYILSKIATCIWCILYIFHSVWPVGHYISCIISNFLVFFG